MNMKKKNLVPKKNSIVSPKTTLSEQEKLDEVIERTDKKIIQGLENPTASTGTPISNLNGGAKFLAQLSNIGGGSVATGGGGIKDGFNTITTNVAAKAKIESIPANNQADTKKIK